MAQNRTVYVFQGCAYGTFKDNAGRDVHYQNLYVTSQMPNTDSDRYHPYGFKAEKFSVVDVDTLLVCRDFTVGDYIKLYFDAKGKVSLIELADY